MIAKLMEAAREGWRCVDRLHLPALVRASPTFEKGLLVERRTRPE
jgi:hypothetical protein